ncbi:serine/threonine-protein kinase Nek8-like isoform X2 [Lineus longissimus]|uniref:serine/threonine-protein kinase Nek8-like isoform X2 n=1 Tax=Lineus longissimus TaxID=88925 RepID=UPI002B4D29A0
MQQRDNLLLTRMLAQYLSHRDAPLDEKEILEIFQQMVAAIRHIHEHNILHRDMKTANIFLTKEGVVKVGDFGISKIMSTTDKGANTVLGTPYYISPEMCEGKEYNDKSDIWALGCILYEMACLQKTFEGSNLPALVNKIMKGQFAPVKGNYSEDFKNLIKDMLEHEPEYRPSANELMYRRLPEKMSTAPQQRKIYKFTMVKDVALLKEIVAINPFSEPSKWKEVLQNFNFYFTGEGQEKKDATERGIVDRFAVLLTKFKKDELTSVRAKLSRRRKQVKT